MSHVNYLSPAAVKVAHQHFSNKLACETDCSDVYAEIKAGNTQFVFVDTRSAAAYQKSHAITAINIPHSEISAERMSGYPKDTLFVVYCWGPGCNGAAKAGYKLTQLGYQTKEMLGGIHYWEDFERYPVNRRANDAQQ